MRARFLVPALVAALAVGCGFAPRGALKVPEGFGPIAVSTADPYSPLGEGLRRDLRRAGAPLAADASAPGSARLAVTAEAWETRPLSVDAFVKQFAPARRVFHARRTKLEQLHRIRAAADGGSGGVGGAVQPSAVSSFLPASSSMPLSGAGAAPRVAGSLYQPAPVSLAAPNRL